MPPQQGNALPDLDDRILDFGTHHVLAEDAGRAMRPARCM